jgi:hypothetical protein
MPRLPLESFHLKQRLPPKPGYRQTSSLFHLFSNETAQSPFDFETHRPVVTPLIAVNAREITSEARGNGESHVLPIGSRFEVRFLQTFQLIDVDLDEETSLNENSVPLVFIWSAIRVVE